MQLARKKRLSWADYHGFKSQFERLFAELGKPEGMALHVLEDPGNECVEVAAFSPERVDLSGIGCADWRLGLAMGDGWRAVSGREDPRRTEGFVPFGRDYMNDALALAIPA